MLPPREGFSPEAVGAIGLLVHRLSGADDLILGRTLDRPPFADRRFAPVVPHGLSLGGAGGRYAAGAARLLRSAPPDLIEVHNRPEVALGLARRLPRVPIMLFLHNDPQGMRQARTPRERAYLARRMGVVAVSDYLRDRFGDGIDEPPLVRLLPNCLDLDALPPPRKAGARDALILFAGRLVADKGADSFVAACARALPSLPGWRAEMIGADRFQADAPETPFLATLRPAAKAAGVTLAGYQPHEAVLAAMSRAAIVVVPSRWHEPFGLTALEAMASGAALVASERGGLGALTRGAAVTIDPDDTDELATVLRRLAADPAERARLSAAGLARAASFGLTEARARLADLRLAAISVPAISR